MEWKLVVSTRTIFLYIRGIDQTGRAFDILDRRMKHLIQNQQYLYKVSEETAKKMLYKQQQVHDMLRGLENASYRLLFAGAAFTAFGAMFMYAIGRVVGASSMGELYVSAFETAFGNLIRNISEAIVGIWGPKIQEFIGWLDELAANETFVAIIAGVGPIAAITITAIGVTLLVTGLVGTFVSKLISLLVWLKWVEEGTIAAKMIGARAGISFALSATILITAVIILKLIGESLKEQIKRHFAESLGVPEEAIPQLLYDPEGFKWEEIFKGLGDVARSIWETFFGWDMYQLGTTGIGNTRPALLHGGEMIFNPQLPITPPLQMRGMMGAGGPISIAITQYIDHIHTEADEDRLAQRTAEYIADRIEEKIG